VQNIEEIGHFYNFKQVKNQKGQIWAKFSFIKCSTIPLGITSPRESLDLSGLLKIFEK